MNGTELRIEKPKPLFAERLKWITILILSHVIVFLLRLEPVKPKEEVPLPVRAHHVRLQLQINNRVPLEDLPKDVLLISNGKVISQKVRLLKKIKSINSMGDMNEVYLLELPEQELMLLSQNKNQVITAYPLNKKLNLQKPRRSYEIIF